MAVGVQVVVARQGIEWGIDGGDVRMSAESVDIP